VTDARSNRAHAAALVERHAPSWLVTVGVRSWLAVGIAFVLVLTYLGIGAAAQLALPMVIAGVIGALFSPLVERMSARGIPKLLATLAVIAALALVVVGTVYVTITGVVDQVDEIRTQLSSGVDELTSTLEDAGVDVSGADAAADAAAAPSQLADAAFKQLSGLFSSLGSLLFGAFIAVFLLYYALMDWPRFERWMADRIGVPTGVGARIVDDAIQDLRLYFGGLTIASIVVALIIGATMWALGLPLAFTVMVVTFVTAYIPYVGAILSGTFAFVVALGSGGLGVAIVVLLVVLVAQNVVQAVLQARITSGGLEVHPALNFASTILGAIVAGAIGAILAAPLVATALKTRRLLVAWYAEGDEAIAAGE
jgi:putative heme transporter